MCSAVCWAWQLGGAVSRYSQHRQWEWCISLTSQTRSTGVTNATESSAKTASILRTKSEHYYVCGSYIFPLKILYIQTPTFEFKVSVVHKRKKKTRSKATEKVSAV